MGTRRQLSVRKSSRTTILIMKVSIIFLAFFVGASYQQGYYWPYPAPYYQPMYNPYQFGFPAPMAPQQISQGRTKVSASDDTAERNVADDGARLFGNNVIFTFNNLLASTSTATVTTFATVSSTATSASVVSCIPSNQFLSNTACRRRRAIFEDSGLEDHIAPSKKEEVEASAIPVEEVKREKLSPRSCRRTARPLMARLWLITSSRSDLLSPRSPPRPSRRPSLRSPLLPPRSRAP